MTSANTKWIVYNWTEADLMAGLVKHLTEGIRAKVTLEYHPDDLGGGTVVGFVGGRNGAQPHERFQIVQTLNMIAPHKVRQVG